MVGALPKNTETLKRMNTNNSKYAIWFVRVVDPRVMKYQFTSRNEPVQAERFQCVLVSANPEEYMLGVVPL